MRRLVAVSLLCTMSLLGCYTSWQPLGPAYADSLRAVPGHTIRITETNGEVRVLEGASVRDSTLVGFSEHNRTELSLARIASVARAYRPSSTGVVVASVVLLGLVGLVFLASQVGSGCPGGRILC